MYCKVKAMGLRKVKKDIPKIEGFLLSFLKHILYLERKLPIYMNFTLYERSIKYVSNFIFVDLL